MENINFCKSLVVYEALGMSFWNISWVAERVDCRLVQS